MALTTEVRRLLERPNYAHLATLLPEIGALLTARGLRRGGCARCARGSARPARGRRVTSDAIREWRSRSST